ncbi:energy transducer TonB [Flavobacterium sp. MC2016-06]|uniref:energy transducer TonB n=1 Tax=Flavobacterium sp. MC2016-06 TaxID=2676308 RepID=UPI0012BA6DFD|nr:energy transducer TonB [Flavobacterium sp. MC2016-06]MBU3862106.1 energy transducer TonB [Flavobacterium sp. MC2016-06]
MSKLSIYETKWTDLVFENRNKEYGAYQLRQENSKTTITALFSGLLLLTALGSVPVLINSFRTAPAPEPVVVLHPVTPIVIHKNIVKPKTTEPIAPPQKAAAAAKPITSSQLVNPVIVPTQQDLPEIATNTNNVPHVENPSSGDGPLVNNAIPAGGEGGGGTITKPVINEPIPIGALDKSPEFPGGIDKFYAFVGKNFTRPELDEEKTLKVYVSFVIERDGSLTDIVVLKDPGFGMGKEAVRVLKSLKTKWVAGVLNKQTVRTAYTLPITIKTQPE